MPVVTRSDCTQTNVQEHYKFAKVLNGPCFTNSVDYLKLQFQACQGANNRNNDLEAFVQQLVNDGKMTTAEQDIFKKRVVGRRNCPSAVDNLLEAQGFQSGHNIDETKWTFVVGESFSFEDHEPILDNRLFQEMLEAQEVPIVRRVCPSCKSDSHKDIYYRRLTPIPEGFDLLDTLMNNWFSADNLLGVDFSLHSTYLDAFLGTNGWKFCNYDDAGVGFPRDCGPEENTPVGFQWNSYYHNGGDANYHAFLLPANPDFQSNLNITYPLYPTYLATDYALQRGTQTHSGKTTIGWFGNDDFVTYASANFGPSGTTKGIKINYSKGNDGGRIEVRLGAGTTGQLIGEFSPAHTSGWHNFMTAYIEIDDVEGVNDITFVAKDRSDGVLDLAWFELADFSERSDEYSRIPANEYSDQFGTQFASSGAIGWFHSGDYITYANVNFGPAGTTDFLLVEFSKGNSGGTVEVKLDGPDGLKVGEFAPYNTGGWGVAKEGYIALDNMIDGVHDLTFVGKDADGGVFDLISFELSKKSDLYPPKTTFLATDYFAEGGTQTLSGTTTIGWIDSGDYLMYASANFGPSGTTKGIKINYSKGNNGGRIEVRLGAGTTGQLIGEFNPAHTSGWHNFMTAYIEIDDVEGVNDITFVAKDSGGVLDLAWFELADFSERSDEYSRIPANEYSDQFGVRFENGHSATGDFTVGDYDSGDYITYANVNFGPAGTTKSVKISYAKGNSGGSVLIKLGGANGAQIGEFTPVNTGGWGNWAEGSISLDVEVDGIHDLTFVGADGGGVLNLEWFEPSL